MTKKSHEDSVENFAHIFALILKTVNPRIDGDETMDIVKDFLMMVAEGGEMYPQDAIEYGHAILTTMDSPSKETH